jgi:hypothetical protein
MGVSSWVELVGYQLEAVHDGALTELLRTPVLGSAVAEAVTGRRVDRVIDAGRQRKVGGAVADVVAAIQTGGETGLLAIETKVDSQASRGQLERTAESGDLVVMLSLGTSAMRTCTVAPSREGDPTWRVIDVTEWARVLEGLGDLPQLMDQYRAAVAEEAQQHARARRIANLTDVADGFAPRIPTTELVGWAWLDETWKAMQRTAPPGRVNAQRDISGPIFFWEDSWRDFSVSAGGLYIDLMVEGDEHVIVLKAADVAPEERRSVHDMIASIRPSRSDLPRRRSTRSDTFRVLTWNVSGTSPDASARAAWDAAGFLARASALH